MTVRKCEINEKSLASVEFSFDSASIEEKKKEAYKKNAAKYNIPGFRRGKAPRALIEKMFGKGVFLEDAINALLGECYEEIVKAPGKEAVSAPSFDIVSEDEAETVLKAEFYVKPEFELEGYLGLEVEAVKTPVSDSEIDAEIESARKRNARELEVSDRPAANGDTAIIHYEGFCDGVAFEGGKGTDHHLELGSGSFIPGFEDQIVGHSAGEEFDVNVTFPEEYHAKELAGKPAVFKVVLKKITVEELPALD
ncbi:MAG: trigger factor, partial [Clostridia bacterium]|nr:trigger factor [Clostridia bacterium]